MLGCYLMSHPRYFIAYFQMAAVVLLALRWLQYRLKVRAFTLSPSPPFFFTL